jgi:hypothetical protein
MRAAAARGKLVRLFAVFVRSIEARQPRVAVDRRCSSDTRPSQLKEHSTLKSLCRGTGDKFARGPGLREVEQHYSEQQIPSSQQHVHLKMAG